MVTIRTVHQPQRPSFDKWLAGLAVSDATREKLASISDQPELLLIGQEMVEILHELNMDDETLQAALVFPYCEMHTLSDVDIETEFGRPIADLVNGVRQMDAIKALHAKHQHDEQQVDNPKNADFDGRRCTRRGYQNGRTNLYFTTSQRS